MGLLGPKGGAQGGAQGSPPKGLYKQRGRLKTLTLATVRPLFWPPLLCAKPLVALADLAVRIATLLPYNIMINLIILRLRLLFIEFKNELATRGRVSWTRFSKFLFIWWVRPQTRLNNMNIIFSTHLFYYLNHLLFKFKLIQKLASNAIN